MIFTGLGISAVALTRGSAARSFRRSGIWESIARATVAGTLRRRNTEIGDFLQRDRAGALRGSSALNEVTGLALSRLQSRGRRFEREEGAGHCTPGGEAVSRRRFASAARRAAPGTDGPGIRNGARLGWRAPYSRSEGVERTFGGWEGREGRVRLGFTRWGAQPRNEGQNASCVPFCSTARFQAGKPVSGHPGDTTRCRSG